MNGDVLTVEQAAARLGTDPDRLARRLAEDTRRTGRATLRSIRGGRDRDADGWPTVTAEAAANVERRYFNWCCEQNVEPRAEHGMTPAETEAMRERFRHFKDRSR